MKDSNGYGVFLGVDTSCYTTSVGVTGPSGEVIGDYRQVLNVKSGERGLRQSEALFQHINNIPDLIERAAVHRPFSAIGYAERPRPQPGSYLPVFTAGANFGKAIAECIGIPAYSFTHQEGHIRAAMIGTGIETGEFLGFHLSGGTTEVLKVNYGFGKLKIEWMGGTSDLHAGQMIDRVGVAIGLPFPAGPHLEQLAKRGNKSFRLPVAVSGLTVSFSGPESAARRALEEGKDPADLALVVQECLVESVSRLLESAVRLSGLKKALFFGGVASNRYIREELGKRHPDYDIYFARSGLSADNAVGIALLAGERRKEELN